MQETSLQICKKQEIFQSSIFVGLRMFGFFGVKKLRAIFILAEAKHGEIYFAEIGPSILH